MQERTVPSRLAAETQSHQIFRLVSVAVCAPAVLDLERVKHG